MMIIIIITTTIPLVFILLQVILVNRVALTTLFELSGFAPEESARQTGAASRA